MQSGLGDFGIYLDNEQAKIILDSLDRKKNGVVSFDEFLRAIRVNFIINLIGRFESIQNILD